MTDRSVQVAAVVRKIAERVTVDGYECWIWQGNKLPKGYGVISFGGSTAYTHRLMYEGEHGPIPAGMQIDHLCRQPSCCNPAHLEVVTPQENTLRGNSPRLARERGGKKTHCPRGHAYTDENTYVSAKGGKSCRICRSLKHAEWAEKRRQRARSTALLPHKP